MQQFLAQIHTKEGGALLIPPVSRPFSPSLYHTHLLRNWRGQTKSRLGAYLWFINIFWSESSSILMFLPLAATEVRHYFQNWKYMSTSYAQTANETKYHTQKLLCGKFSIDVICPFYPDSQTALTLIPNQPLKESSLICTLYSHFVSFLETPAT